MAKASIYCIGDKHSWSRYAGEELEKKIGVNCEMIGLHDLSEVIEKVNSPGEFGIIPLYNTINGDMEKHLRMLYSGLREGIYVGELIEVPISQVLAGKGRPEKIEEIFSHPMALEQAEKGITNFMKEYCTDIRCIACDSTDEAARIASESGSGKAAICSRGAAEEYGLEIFGRMTEGTKTTFGAIGHEDDWQEHFSRPAEGTSERVASVIIEPSGNSRGLLDTILAGVKKKYDLNHVVSLTAKGPLLFYMEIMNPDGDRLYRLLDDICNKVDANSAVLGVHPPAHRPTINEMFKKRPIRAPKKKW